MLGCSEQVKLNPSLTPPCHWAFDVASFTGLPASEASFHRPRVSGNDMMAEMAKVQVC